MTHTEFFKQLNSESLNNVYLFCGEEKFVCDSALSQLKAKFSDEIVGSVNVSVLEDPEYEDVVAACNTMPFFAEKRLVIVNSPANLTASGKTREDAGFIEYLKNPNPSTVLVLVCPQPDKRKKLYKQLEKFTVDFNILAPNELASWIVQFLKRRGTSISRENADFIVSYAEASASNLACQLEKLSDYVGQQEVTRDDILLNILPGEDYNIFKMVDCIFSGDKKSALDTLGTMLAQREDEFYILGAISRQARLLLGFKTMLNEKRSKAEIVKQLQIRDFVFPKMKAICDKKSEQALKAALDLCFEADKGLKSGKQFPQVALHQLIINLCNI